MYNETRLRALNNSVSDAWTNSIIDFKFTLSANQMRQWGCVSQSERDYLKTRLTIPKLKFLDFQFHRGSRLFPLIHWKWMSNFELRFGFVGEKKSTLVLLTWAKVDEVYQFLAKLALVQGNQLLALLCSPFLWFVVSFLFLFQITSWSPHICKNFSRIFQNYTSVPRIPLIMATTNLWNIPCFGVIESGITSSWLLVWQSFTS